MDILRKYIVSAFILKKILLQLSQWVMTRQGFMTFLNLEIRVLGALTIKMTHAIGI